jgi:hypothetical protein
VSKEAREKESRPPWPRGTPRGGYLGLGSFAAAVVPMILVELALLILLLLIEPKFAGSQASSLIITTVNNRTLIALAASAIVFPVLLQPLVRVFAMTYESLPSRVPLLRALLPIDYSRRIPQDTLLSHNLDIVLWRKFGFKLSDFSQELDTVLEQPEQERLGSLETRIERQRLRASSYLLSALPLAVTAAILWDRFDAGGVLSSIGVWLLALILFLVAHGDARRVTSDYWSMQGSLAVQHRFDILRSLSLRPPTNLADERELWKKARAVTLSPVDLLYPRTTEDSPKSPAEERRIRYAYEMLSAGETETRPALPEEPWVVEYDGFVSATWRAVPGSTVGHEHTSSPATGALTVIIDRTEHAANAERISVGGRRAPYAEFRVVPDSDDVDVVPSEMVLKPSNNSADTGAFTTSRRPGHDDPRLWVRVYQYKRLVASVGVDWMTDGGDPQ